MDFNVNMTIGNGWVDSPKVFMILDAQNELGGRMGSTASPRNIDILDGDSQRVVW